MKLELLTNATVVDDAIRFVSKKSKSQIESSDNDSGDDKQESNEPEYNEDGDQLQEEQEAKIASENTINQVF